MARALMERGFTRVRPLAGGLDAWLAAGFPVEDSEELPPKLASGS
ncbi:MAG: hypothetical protein ABI682_00180 [Acidobacteriota bacterium]